MELTSCEIPVVTSDWQPNKNKRMLLVDGIDTVAEGGLEQVLAYADLPIWPSRIVISDPSVTLSEAFHADSPFYRQWQDSSLFKQHPFLADTVWAHCMEKGGRRTQRWLVTSPVTEWALERRTFYVDFYLKDYWDEIIAKGEEAVRDAWIDIMRVALTSHEVLDSRRAFDGPFESVLGLLEHGCFVHEIMRSQVEPLLIKEVYHLQFAAGDIQAQAFEVPVVVLHSD